MIFEGVLLGALVRLALAVLAAGLGVTVLFRGRRLVWLFSGAAAYLLGLLLVRILDGIFGTDTATADGLTWQHLVPIAAAVLGALAGQYRRTIAYVVIGVATGGVLAIWIAQLMQGSESASITLDFWSALVIVIFMGLGALFVLRYEDVALIILSAGVGSGLIIYTLQAVGLPGGSDLVAQLISALAIAAAIASLVIQYHDYLAELRATHRLNEMGAGLLPTLDGGEESALTLPAK